MSLEKSSLENASLIQRSSKAVEKARSLRRASDAIHDSSHTLREELHKLFDTYSSQTDKQEEIEKKFKK